METEFIKEKPLIVLTGPTAVGKTELSIRLAKAIGGEIISADSMQVYRHMDIGTAKISPAEMQGVPHYLIDCMEPEEEFNITVFQRMAKDAIRQIYQNGHIPVIVGGTGFYIQSVLYDVCFDLEKPSAPAVSVPDGTDLQPSDNVRGQLMALAEQFGPGYLHRELKKIDPVSAGQIHPNNIKRVVRAIEFYRQTGQPISAHNETQREKESPYRYLYFVLNDERSLLYERIDRRVDEMFVQGLEREVSALIERGCTKEMVSMQGIGYKEMLDYFAGAYDLEQAKYLIKRNTRHFAKRQITWFKRERAVTWMNYTEYGNSKDALLKEMLRMITEKTLI